MIFLQQVQETASNLDAFLMFLATVLLLLSVLFSKKVNLGIYLPGVAVPLTRARKKILNQYFPYYAKLTGSKKKLFERKVQGFIYRKEFIPRNLESVTEEMKVLIAACAVQLTLGFPNVALSHFSRILVYPDDYYSTISRRFHRGEVNPRLGAIVLSWRHFLEGYIQSSDGINLGLHEMAHALSIENRIRNGEYAFLDENAQSQWEVLAQEEIDRIRSGHIGLFRAYAGTNTEEFFAVAVENFFERPQTFKDEIPSLYENLALILKQDPLKS